MNQKSTLILQRPGAYLLVLTKWRFGFLLFCCIFGFFKDYERVEEVVLKSYVRKMFVKWIGYTSAKYSSSMKNK